MRPSPGFRHGRVPGTRQDMTEISYGQVVGRPARRGFRSGLPTLLTWMIRSPSRIRPSLAAMLLGFTCKAHTSWGLGTSAKVPFQ